MRKPITMERALAGEAGHVQLTPSLSADQVRRLERCAARLALNCSATIRHALARLDAYVSAGNPPPYAEVPSIGTGTRRLSSAAVRAGADGWAMPTYSLQTPAARLLHRLAVRTRRNYSAVVRAALVVVERELAGELAARAA